MCQSPCFPFRLRPVRSMWLVRLPHSQPPPAPESKARSGPPPPDSNWIPGPFTHGKATSFFSPACGYACCSNAQSLNDTRHYATRGYDRMLVTPQCPEFIRMHNVLKLPVSCSHPGYPCQGSFKAACALFWNVQFPDFKTPHNKATLPLSSQI